MKKYMKKIVQIFFLGLFVFLIVTNRPQLWMGLFLIGIIGSFFFGRFYCGWICSINTIMDIVTSFKKKHGIKNKEIPQAIKNPFVRWGLLVLLFITSIFVMVTGKELPILHILFLLGILFTFFFHEELWHKFLCPYGGILNQSSKATKKGMTVNPKVCDNCGDCVESCPALAIEKNSKTHFINKTDCLVCMRCFKTCKPKAISYR